MSDDDDAFDLLLATLRHKRNGAGQFALLRFGCRRPADCHTTHMHHNELSSGAPDAAFRLRFQRRNAQARNGALGNLERRDARPRMQRTAGGGTGGVATYISTRLTAGFGARGVATYHSSQTGKRGQERGGSGPSSKIYS